MEQTDAQLIDAYTAGDSAAFAALVHRHAGLVYAAARQRTGDPATADDVTQAVFVVLARKAVSLRHRPTVAGWLLGVTRHVALTANRAAARRARHERAAAKPEVTVIDSPSTGTSPEFLNVLGDALLTLRSVERDAITLRFFQGLSMADVGHLLGTGEDAARKRVARALDKLRHRLLRRGMALPAGGLAAGVTLFASQPAPAGVMASASTASGAAVTPLAGNALAMLAIKKGMTMVTAALAVILGAIAVRAVTADKPSTPPTPLAAVTTAPATTAPAVKPAAVPVQAAIGHVVNVDGSPAVGAFVCLSTRMAAGQSAIAGTAITDDQGNFSIEAAGPLMDPRLAADIPQIGLSVETGWTAGTPATLSLAPPAAAKFRVMLPDGKPAAGLRVWPGQVTFVSLPGSFSGFAMSIADHFKRWAVTTDANGIATLAGLPVGGRLVLATDDPRFAKLTYEDNVAVEATPAGALPSVQLMAAGQISGRVTYGDTDKPAAGLALFAQTLDNAPHISGGAATTDSDGRFVIARVKPGPFAVCLASRESIGPWCAAAARVDVGTGEHATADLRLIQGSVITGHVRDAVTGRGFAGLNIGAHSPAHPSEAASIETAKTDAQGRYELRVPPGHAEVYLADALPNGYVAPAVGTSTHAAPLDVAGGTVVSFDFDLRPDNVPDLKGTVVDGDGKPVPGAIVNWVANGSHMPWEQTAVCDQAGRFSIHVNDTLTLRARAGKRATLAAVVVEPGAAPVTLRVVEGAQYNVVTTVLDDTGRPLATATVELNIMYGPFGTGSPKRPVDSQGVVRFAGLFKDSSYSVWAEAPGFGVTQRKLAPAPGAAFTAVTLQLIRADQHISGVVVDDDGTGVPNLDVMLNGGTTGLMKTRTDNDGHFDFAVVPDARGLISFPRVVPAPNKPRIVTDAKAGQTDLRIAIPTVSVPN